MSARLIHAYRSIPLVVLSCLVLAGPRAASADEEAAGKVPLKKVVLFNSGVGFYEHLGQVDGDAAVGLRFKVDDINDLLKSMVLQDMGGGRISTVSYGSRDPISKTLKTFAIDLTTNPTLSQLLGQVRGEKVTVSTTSQITGTIIGVETRKQQVGKDQVMEVDYLNLLTDEGMRSVALNTITLIKFESESLDKEFREALRVLATAHDVDKKSVTLNFLGQGKRPVRVGYIQESPIWKTSYRLVLGEKNPPQLQGWAIVENTTDQDWKDVQLTLVSGRPISFVMDLYSPLYAPRPVVEPELYASLRPQSYEQDMASKDAQFRALRKGEGRPGEGKALARSGGGFGGGPPGSPAPAADAAYALEERAARNEPFDPTQGVRSAAQAGDVGELFQYAIGTPVTLARQRSAMLPIVNDSVEGEKVSIYNQAVHAKHPLNGLKLKNTSGLHLMQGPITVFDDGVYAGDAKIADLQPGGERLISYAMDLDTEVAPTSKGHPEQLVSVRIVKGTLYATRKYTRTHSYVVKNGGKKEKKVLVEYPLDTNWKLIAPEKPAEKTRDMYRFAVNAKPGEPATLDIEEEQVAQQAVAVTDLDDYSIRMFLSAKVVSDKVKAALQEVVRRKSALGQTLQDRQRKEQEIAVIDQEQNRIRQNMQQLPKESDLYNRYVKKFTEQEDRIETLRKEIAALQAQEAKQRKELNDYLMDLDLS